MQSLAKTQVVWANNHPPVQHIALWEGAWGSHSAIGFFVYHVSSLTLTWILLDPKTSWCSYEHLRKKLFVNKIKHWLVVIKYF